MPCTFHQEDVQASLGDAASLEGLEYVFIMIMKISGELALRRQWASGPAYGPVRSGSETAVTEAAITIFNFENFSELKSHLQQQAPRTSPWMFVRGSDIAQHSITGRYRETRCQNRQSSIDSDVNARPSSFRQIRGSERHYFRLSPNLRSRPGQLCEHRRGRD